MSRNAWTHLRQELASRSFVLGGIIDAVAVFLGVVPVTVLVTVVEGDDDDDDSVAMIYIVKCSRQSVRNLKINK
jgi:hypothetical protein